MPALGPPWRPGTGDSFPISVDANGRRDGPARSFQHGKSFPLRSPPTVTNRQELTLQTGVLRTFTAARFRIEPGCYLRNT